MQPDPELPEFDPGLRRFWLLALAVLILGAVAFLAGRPAYRWVRTERARRLVEETVPAVEAGRWDEVQRAAAVAAGLAPNEPRVRWLMARLYSAGNLAEGLDLWDRLPPGSLTADDRLAWAGLALAKDRLDVATRLLNDLMTETPDAPPVLHLAMITAERQGDVPLALRLAARWLERHPGDLDAQWQLGRRLRVVADPGLRAKGRQMLLELTGKPNPFRVLAGGTLADDPELSASDRALLRDRLIEMKASPLAIDALRYHLTPSDRPAIVEGVAKRARPETNRVAFVAALSWLLEHGGTGEVVELLGPDRIAGDPELSRKRIELLVQSGRTDEARRALDAAGSDIEDFQRHCLAAALALAGGRESEADDLLTAAVGSSRGSPAALEFIAAQAVRLGRWEPAIKALEPLLAVPANRVRTARLLLSVALRQGKLSVARRSVDALRIQLPTDPNVHAVSAYLRFLDGDGTREDLGWIREQLASGNTETLLLAARALGRWRLGEAEAGLEEVEALAPEHLAADPRLRMTHALLLAANQRREAARQAARGIPEDGLLAEELRLVRDSVR